MPSECGAISTSAFNVLFLRNYFRSSILRKQCPSRCPSIMKPLAGLKISPLSFTCGKKNGPEKIRPAGHYAFCGFLRGFFALGFFGLAFSCSRVR